MPASFNQKLRESRPIPRIFLWTLLGVFNAFLWVMLLRFDWEISMRSREAAYFGTQLFPIGTQAVPLPVIYTACALLTLASAGTILRDRSNMAARERIRTLLFQILDSFAIGVVVLDDKDQLTMANDSARQLLPEIPLGYTSLDFIEVLGTRPRLQQLVKAAARERIYQQDVEHDLGKRGDPWPVRVTTLPLKDPQKRTTGTLLLVHDVREAVRMERQMRTAERLSSLGTLAAAMAHEIRNPLEAMNLNLALLERNLASPVPQVRGSEKTGKYLKILESEISRLGSIVENFLSFARPSDAPTGELRVDSLLRQIVDLLANQAKSRNVKLDLSSEDNLTVVGVEDLLKQAFLNLMINSLEAMPGGGSLGVRAEAVRQQATDGKAADLVVVSIRDTGVGVPPEQLARLFDPYFTTRPKGTGLGLTIVHRVIDEHHGRIRVASVPGEGTTFTVELPMISPDGGKEKRGHV